MIEQLVENTGTYIQTNPWLAVVAVFVGGALTASNPCVIAMIPLMMSFVAGRRDEQTGISRALLYSFVFVLGLAITFTALGMIAALAGQMYGDVSEVWNWIVAAVCLVMGLHLMEVLRFTIPMPIKVQPQTRGIVGAFVLGLRLGLVGGLRRTAVAGVRPGPQRADPGRRHLDGRGAQAERIEEDDLDPDLAAPRGRARDRAGRCVLRLPGSRLRSKPMKTLSLAMLMLLFLAVVGCGGPEPEPQPTAAAASPGTPAAQTEGAAPRTNVAKIVFVGQKEACPCTRDRIDTTWNALESTLNRPSPTARRYQSRRSSSTWTRSATTSSTTCGRSWWRRGSTSSTRTAS
jgi:hypothetical protein